MATSVTTADKSNLEYMMQQVTEQQNQTQQDSETSNTDSTDTTQTHTLSRKLHRAQKQEIKKILSQTNQHAALVPQNPHNACPSTTDEVFDACGCHPLMSRIYDLNSQLHLDEFIMANTEQCLSTNSNIDFGKAKLVSTEITSCVSSKQDLSAEQQGILSTLIQDVIGDKFVNEADAEAWSTCYQDKVLPVDHPRRYLSSSLLRTSLDSNIREGLLARLESLRSSAVQASDDVTTYLQAINTLSQRGWYTVRATLLQNTNPGNALLESYIEKFKPSDRETELFTGVTSQNKQQNAQIVTPQAQLPSVELAKSLLSNSAAASAFIYAGTGNDFTVTLTNGGQTQWWGNNHNGTSREYEKFAMIDAGTDFFCGLTSDMTLACHGILPFETSEIPQGEFVDLSVGKQHACAIDSKNQVTCWGNNAGGQTTVPDEKFMTVSAGDYHNCGLNLDGEVACWGRGDDELLQAPDVDFISVSAGGYHNCGITPDQNVLCWGNNSMKQQEVPNDHFMQISAGLYHSCGITTEKKVVCWGNDVEGQRNTDTLPATTYVSVSAGNDHSCAVTKTGSKVCWGNAQSY